jgi:hypothetical protein
MSSDLFGGAVGLLRHRSQHGEPLGGDLQAVLPEQFDRFAGRGHRPDTTYPTLDRVKMSQPFGAAVRPTQRTRTIAPVGHLLLFADSLAFHGPAEAVAPPDPRLYANIAAEQLGSWSVDLLARPGWTARDGWWALTKDPVAWGVYVPRASAIVLALGQMDQLPAALPTWLRESMPYIRPGRVRRRVRSAYRSAAPHVIRGTGGRLPQLSIPATSHYLGRMVGGIRTYRPEVPIVRLLPAPHDAAIYPSQRHHAEAVAAGRRWCAQWDVAGIDLDPLVGPHLAAGRNNPDGMHWGWEAHADIGAALADALRQ